MRKLNSSIVVDFFSEKGLDKVGRTYFAYVPLENMVCYAVAESYDSDNDINSAEMAVEAVLVAFERNPSFRNLKSYIDYANGQLMANSVKNKLETAITVVVSDYTRIKYASCGNIKLFLLSDNAFYLKSETQTYYQFAANEYGFDKAPRTENKNLTQYLGKKDGIKPFISKKIDLLEESTMLFATCGVWDRVDDVEILDAYEESEPDKFLGNIQELYLQTQLKNPAIGSYTLASLFVEKTFKEDVNKKKKRRRNIIIASIVLLILLIVVTVLCIADSSAMAKIRGLDDEGKRYSDYGNYQMAFEQYDKAKGLTEKLRKDLLFIRDKKNLSEDIMEKWRLFNGIKSGDEFLETGKYVEARTDYIGAQRASRLVFYNVDAKAYAKLPVPSILAQKIEQIDRYVFVDHLIDIGKLYEINGEYSDALDCYEEAEAIAKLIGDLALSKEVVALKYEAKMGRKENADEGAVGALREQMTEAEERFDFELALEYCIKILRIYEDMEVTDSQAQADQKRINEEIDASKTAIKNIDIAKQAADESRYDDAVRYYESVLTQYGIMGIGVQHDKYWNIDNEIARLKRLIEADKPREQEPTSPREPNNENPREPDASSTRDRNADLDIR
ncbi:MAG: hypothetical protein FWG42_09835 [Clostridiales bacterium]|nr:hypothetical protein [Clostridiales bacterium]